VKPGDRVEVLLHRGMADVWYSGAALAGGAVQLDPHEYDWPLELRAEPADICERRPISAPG
jgi:hypothetical protein